MLEVFSTVSRLTTLRQAVVFNSSHIFMYINGHLIYLLIIFFYSFVSCTYLQLIYPYFVSVNSSTDILVRAVPGVPTNTYDLRVPTTGFYHKAGLAPRRSPPL